MPETVLYIFFDCGEHKRLEFDCREQDSYFASKITKIQLNVLLRGMKKSRIIYGWSEMEAGHTVHELTTCLRHIFQNENPGFEHLVVSSDSALISAGLLQFFSCACHPDNPERVAKTIKYFIWIPGHSRNLADSLSAQAQIYFSRKESFHTCSTRAQWLNKEAADSRLKLTHMQDFFKLPSEFAKIFIQTKNWVDQFEIPVLCKWDKRLSFEFGSSEVFDSDLDKFVREEHYSEFWI